MDKLYDDVHMEYKDQELLQRNDRKGSRNKIKVFEQTITTRLPDALTAADVAKISHGSSAYFTKLKSKFN